MLNMFLKKLKDLLDIKMCGYYCIGFICFMFAGRSFIDFTSLFSPYDFKKNDDIIFSYFK